MKKFLTFLVLFAAFTHLAAAKSALVIVDMQKCFVPGADDLVHSLPVAGGHDIVAGINQLQKKFNLVVATKDWHPKNHGSFASQHSGKNPFEMTILAGLEQMLWPDHCTQGSVGAEFVAALDTEKIAHITRKGTHSDVDSYSGFMDNNKVSKTDLDSFLKSQGVDSIFVVGLAADYCVKATAIDAAHLNYKTFFVQDLTKAVDPSAANMKNIYAELKRHKVEIISSQELLNNKNNL